MNVNIKEVYNKISGNSWITSHKMYPDRNYTWLHYVYIFGGVYDSRKLKTRLKRWLYRLYSIFLAGYCLVYFFPSELSYLPQTMDDLYVFLNAVGLFTTHLLGVAKWLAMFKYQNVFEKIQNQLISKEYHYESYKDFKPGATQFQCRKYARILIITFLFFGNFVPITKDMNFIYNFTMQSDQIGTNVTCLELLPFYSYIPFNIESYWMCIFGFIFQSYPVTGFVGPIICVYDSSKLKTRRNRLLVLLYNIFLITYCMIFYFPSEVAYLDQEFGDLYGFLNVIGIFTLHCVGVLKWVTVLLYRNEFFIIQNQLDNEKYHYEDYDEFKPGEIQFKCRKYTRILIVTFFLFGNFVPFTKDMNFIYDFAMQGDLIGTGNVTCLELLPFSSYIPYNIDSYWKCIFGFVFFQCIPLTGFVGPIISFDLKFAVVTIFLCGNFINIQNAFRTMRERCLVRLGLPEDYKVLRDTENPLLEKEIAAEVRKLSIHLQEHIDIVLKMESMCRYVILGQAMTALFALVTCLYILSVESSFSPMLVAQIHYGVSINIQLSSYCIVGDAITEWSSNVATGIVNSDWLSCTKTVKMSLMINLMRLQKPIYYTIGKFTPLTLNTFLQIVKGSYSYFTFLQKT